MTWLEWLIISIVFIVALFLVSAIKILREYERAVKFRLGRFVGIKGPGLFFIVPGIDSLAKVDLRVITLDVPKQRIVTKDNVSVDVDAVVYVRVFNPSDAIMKVAHYLTATSLLAQTTLRDVLGKIDLDALLTQREDLSKSIQKSLDAATDPWGMKVTAVTIRDVTIPAEMMRAIAKQAEAERERRSRVIMALGEAQAAAKMAEAAKLYEKNPAGMRLRELQMLIEVAREKNLIVVTPTQAGTPLGEVAGLVSALKKRGK
ncbi:MAG: slipin family protein [Hadesarchaea archaeon]|nr:slipin family protein [Hadesarchaea archaeon]